MSAAPSPVGIVSVGPPTLAPLTTPSAALFADPARISPDRSSEPSFDDAFRSEPRDARPDRREEPAAAPRKESTAEGSEKSRVAERDDKAASADDGASEPRAEDAAAAGDDDPKTDRTNDADAAEAGEAAEQTDDDAVEMTAADLASEAPPPTIRTSGDRAGAVLHADGSLSEDGAPDALADVAPLAESGAETGEDEPQLADQAEAVIDVEVDDSGPDGQSADAQDGAESADDGATSDPTADLDAADADQTSGEDAPRRDGDRRLGVEAPTSNATSASQSSATAAFAAMAASPNQTSAAGQVDPNAARGVDGLDPAAAAARSGAASAGAAVARGVSGFAGAYAQAAAQAPNVAQQLGAAITAKTDAGHIELRLDPPELGKVSIDMTFEDGRLAVVVQAERSDALDLMRRNAADLVRELREAGVDLASLDFQSSGDGGGDAGDGDAEASNRDGAGHVIGRLGSDADAAGPIAAAGVSDWTPGAGLDLRI